jgi:hypothetical protein
MQYSQTPQEAYNECWQEAISAGALEPQGLLDRMAAGHMAYNGQSWADTPKARARLQEMLKDCMWRKGFSV